jgi:hypothetical protein
LPCAKFMRWENKSYALLNFCFSPCPLCQTWNFGIF